jgi:DNA repair exonuclease SbcCD ATPase subunit
LLQARSEHAATRRHKRIEELEQGPVADQTNKELSRLRKAQIRWQSDKPKRQQQIEALCRELAELEVRAETVQKTESRLQRLIEEQMVRQLSSDRPQGVLRGAGTFQEGL